MSGTNENSEACAGSLQRMVRPTSHNLTNICGEGEREITAAVELPTVILRQGSQALTLHSEEQLCELMELIEECFTFFDAVRQPKAQPSRPNAALCDPAHGDAGKPKTL